MQQPDISLRGAVDLGARQAAAKRQQEASKSPGGAGQHVIEVTDQTFNAEVVARSRAVPVIVDLWADWCEPCKQLGPVLEKLAAEADGAWLLAKVDVDANPALAEALQAQSIPMVVAVIGGQLVDGFLGALPEQHVREWISQVLQAAAQLGLTGGGSAPAADGQPGTAPADGQAAAPAGGVPAGGVPAGAGPAGPADPLDELAREARQAMERGDMDAAATALEKVLEADPGNPAATAWLAQVDLVRRVRSYDVDKVQREARTLPDDPQAQARAADLELAANQIDAAFDRLLGVIQRTSGEQRDAAREHLVGLFEMLPAKDSRVARARARLSSLLF